MWHEYPYTDAHELNLDWFLKEFKNLVETWEQVQNDWNSLHDYVQNYFDNLNVQTEIDNKINAMILDGTFADIVSPLITAALPTLVAGQLPDVVASQISAVVAAQISAVVADQLPAVAAAAAAQEVGDWLTAHIDPDTGYVIDDTLTVTDAAADAKTVGDSINNIKDYIDILKNALNIYKISSLYEDGKYVSNTNAVGSAADSCLTDYIAVREGQIINIKNLWLKGSRALCKYTTTGLLEHSFVDAIEYGDQTVETYTYTVEPGITYLRATGKDGIPVVFEFITPVNKLNRTCYISTSGDDDNDGTLTRPFLTISHAIDSGYKNIIMYGGVYNESQIDLTNVYGEIKISALEKNKNVTIRPSDCIIGSSATDLTGYTKVKYIDKTLVFDDANVWIFQDTVDDILTERTSSTILPQERGRRYRCEDTKISKCANAVLADALTEIEDSSDYLWYYDSDNHRLYFSCPSTVTSDNPICYSSGKTLFINGHRGVTLNMSAIRTKYMGFNINNTADSYIKDCASMNVYGAGAFTYDSVVGVTFERCEACHTFNAGAGDGFNGHSVKTGDVFSKQTTCYLLDCWSHDNMDDGYSDHERSETVLRGGLYEFNGKGGVTPSYGSHCSCYDVISRNNYNGFYFTGVASDGGYHGQMICFNCVADSNKTGGTQCGFRIDGTSAYNRMYLVNCKSINNGIGYCVTASNYATLIDCGSRADTVTKENNGTMTIQNTTIVT